MTFLWCICDSELNLVERRSYRKDFKLLFVCFLRELLHLLLTMDSWHGPIRSSDLLWLHFIIRFNLLLLHSCQEFSLEALFIWEGLLLNTWLHLHFFIYMLVGVTWNIIYFSESNNVVIICIMFLGPFVCYWIAPLSDFSLQILNMDPDDLMVTDFN